MGDSGSKGIVFLSSENNWAHLLCLLQHMQKVCFLMKLFYFFFIFQHSEYAFGLELFP